MADNHRPKKEYSEVDVEEIAIDEIRKNLSYAEEDSSPDDYDDLEYDTDDLEEELEQGETVHEENISFNKVIEPNLNKDSALGFKKNEDNKNVSPEANKKEETKSKILYGAVYEMKPEIKYSIVGGKIYIFYNPLIYCPTKDEIESAIAISILKNLCMRYSLTNFYMGEIVLIYNPAIQTNDAVMTCIKFIIGLIERRKLNV